MKIEELKEQLRIQDEIIRIATDNKKDIIDQYVKENAKFKVGDKVICDSQIGFIAKVEYKSYSNGKISYQVNKQKKDGTMSSHILRYFVSDKDISLA